MSTTISTGTSPALRLLAFAAGMLAIGSITLTTSRAAFTDTTGNAGSSFSAGTVTLSDDDQGQVLFDVVGMAPGSSAAACIAVSYEGSIADPGRVSLYSGGFSGSTVLAGALLVTVEEGAGGAFGDCAGFVPAGTLVDTTLAGFDATHVSYASGVGTWTPATSPESRTYRMLVQLDPAAPDTVQGTSVADVAFVWEVRSS